MYNAFDNLIASCRKEHYAGVSNDELIKIATEAISRLNKGVEKWSMSIPARQTDHDIIFGELIGRLRVVGSNNEYKN